MTDRGAEALSLSPSRLQIGPSSMRWDGTRLVIDIDETAVPHLDQVRGQVRLTPDALTGVEVALTPDGAHVWRPFAPIARIDVELDRQGWRWQGHGYFDANFGTRALEADFRYWTWARLPTTSGAVALYDAERRDGSTLALALRFDRTGRVERFAAPPKARLPRSPWTVRRETRADAGYRPRQVKPMLDSPFYVRSAIRTRIDGEEAVGVHEALDLDRFASPLIKPMLAVRVPRRARWRAKT